MGRLRAQEETQGHTRTASFCKDTPLTWSLTLWLLPPSSLPVAKQWLIGKEIQDSFFDTNGPAHREGGVRQEEAGGVGLADVGRG